MPYIYEWVEPEIAYNKGVTIYKTYSDDNYDDPYIHWFSLDFYCKDEDENQFDIRDFKIYDENLSIEENFDILIQEGYITKDSWSYNLIDFYKVK